MDNKGCPLPLPPGTVMWADSDDECMMLQPVPFPKGSATLAPDGQAVVEAIAHCMNVHADLLVLQVRGYSDPQERSPDLGLQRAQAVVNGLVARGTDARRLRGVAGDPLLQLRTGEGLQSVDFLVLRTLSCPAAFEDDD